jgi:pimeloyl-ACP methyl ester carboxylesterase
MTHFTFVLLPGAGGSPWYWQLVAPILQGRGHHAVLVELPAADDRVGLSDYADAVIRAVGPRDPKHLVLVAQSLAGFTVPLVCRKVRPALVVLVNAMIPISGETPGEWWGNTGQAKAKHEKGLRDGRNPDAPFDPLIDFFHDVPQHVIDDAWAQGESRQSDAIFRSPCNFGEWPEIPTRVLVGHDDRFFPAEFQHQVARDRLGVSADEMPGGHLVALSQPEELSERLLAYASETNAG